MGNLFENYDAALFGVLSPFLAPIIFPDKEPLSALIWMYAMIPITKLAKPLGAVLFGYVGDTCGRRHALFFTMLGMAFVSFFIGASAFFSFFPLIAPLVFFIGKALQNFFAAGETMGGAIFLLEKENSRHQDFLSGLYSASTVGGSLLASLLVALLNRYSMLETKWPILYLIGACAALFGFMLRKIESTAAQVDMPARISFYEHIKKMWHYRRAMLSISIASGFSYACYTLSFVLSTGLIPMVTKCTLADMIKLNAFLLVTDFLLLPLFGFLAGKYSRHTMMLIASFAAIVIALPSFAIMQGASLSLIVALRLIFVAIGVAFAAPFHAWAQEQIPKDARYTIVSFADAIGSQIFGAPAAFLSLWLFKKTDILFLAGSYWCLMAMVTFSWIYFEGAYRKKKILV